MRIVFSSDWHGHIPDITSIPEADVLCLTGDQCPNWSRNWRNDVDLQIGWIHAEVNPWLLEVKKKVKHVLCLFGNHDGAGTYYGIQKEIEAEVLHDRSAIIDGVKFWGSSWTLCPPWYRNFDQWCFGRKSEEDLKKVWDLIPDDTQVLLTHSPPYGCQDIDTKSRDKECIGSTSLTERVSQLTKLRYHAYGHCHNPVSQMATNHGVLSINAAGTVIPWDATFH